MFAPLAYAKAEPHRIAAVIPHGDKPHLIPVAQEEQGLMRCGAHGHCGTCDAPVSMDKLGRFRHLELKRVRYRHANGFADYVRATSETRHPVTSTYVEPAGRRSANGGERACSRCSYPVKEVK